MAQDDDRAFLDRTLARLRHDALAAVQAWHNAGGYWAGPGNSPTQSALFAVAEELRRRYDDLSASCLPSDPDVLIRRIRSGDRGAIDDGISWLDLDHFARSTGYLKQRVMRALSQTHLTEDDRERLRRTLLAFCTRGRRQEFEEARRLARRRLASQAFADELQRLADEAADPTTREAAMRMLLAVRSAI